jgi:hypothetical protein
LPSPAEWTVGAALGLTEDSPLIPITAALHLDQPMSPLLLRHSVRELPGKLERFAGIRE